MGFPRKALALLTFSTLASIGHACGVGLDTRSVAPSQPAASSPTPTWNGSRNFGVASKIVSPTAVMSDSAGNIFVAGFTHGGLNGNTQVGVIDLFLIKYDPTGSLQWTRQLGHASTAVGVNSAAIDSAGNIYVAGNISGDFDGVTLSGSIDAFVTKFDSGGTRQWTVGLSGGASTSTQHNGIAVDPSGNVFVTGQTTGTLPGQSRTGNTDLYVAKYDKLGTRTGVKQLGVSSKNFIGQAVATDPSGNVVVTGNCDAAFNGAPAVGNVDFFVIKFDGSANPLWNLNKGNSGHSSFGMAVTSDAAGNTYISGYTSGALTGAPLIGLEDLFIAKYDTSGAQAWMDERGVPAHTSHSLGLAIDSAGNTYATGYSDGPLDGTSIPSNASNVLLIKHDASGTWQWTRAVGSGANAFSEGRASALSPYGSIFIAGDTNGPFDGLTQIGSGDGLVTHFDASGNKL